MQKGSMLPRRQFLKIAGAGMGTGLACQMEAASDAARDAPLIVDCHAHIYGEDEAKYPTIADPYRPPKGTGTVPHLTREMRAAGVRYVTVIQTSTYYRWDNRFTVDTARANPDRMVGVCTLNPDDPDSPRVLEEYVAGYNVRGMRSIEARLVRRSSPTHGTSRFR